MASKQPDLGEEQQQDEAADASEDASAFSGKIIDFIDGKLRSKTPEEYVRQNVERSLVHEYHYAREDIEVEFRIKVGSSKKAVDLAIFSEGQPHTQEHIRVILECKRERTSPYDKKEGVGQLHSYMSACPNCGVGMWTNGTTERLCYFREDSAGMVSFSEIVDMPRKGEDIRDADLPTRLKLVPATGDNLLLAFGRCHNYIAGNQGLQKPEAFWELLKVIFCKIEDERALGSVTFYVTTREQKSADGQLKCRKRIVNLFDKVKTKYASIFKANEEIDLNRTVLAYVISQIQGYSLLESPVDVKGIAYEEIVGSNLRGDRGEFFTPRNACRMAVQLLNPQPNDRIVDPACGTGGFLVIAMKHVLDKLDSTLRGRWRNPDAPTQAELTELFRARNELMTTTVVGLDINPNLVRASKMNMVMNNDGSGGLTQADSLRDPVTWSDEARELAPLGSFDYLFTNPPFGTKIRIDSPEVLEQFDLAAIWDLDPTTRRWAKRVGSDGKPILQARQPPEILFIERAVQLLKPGSGKMAMVIPNGILNNAPLGYVRQWVLDRTQVLAIVDMQRDLFQPQNDTQTSMVFLRRKGSSELGRQSSYPIFMAVADRIGHDKRGNPIYCRHPDGSDVIETRRIPTTVVVGGEAVEQLIEEKGPVVDDQLAGVPSAYRRWAMEQGV